MNPKILFVTATHGNESIGVEVIKKIKNNKESRFSDIIANPKAFEQNKRFIESDLNRIFPGKINGTYEERLAKKIVDVGKSYNWIIDLHGSASPTGIFIIITKFTLANFFLALRFDIPRIVIWPNTKETNGSLSTFMPTGIEIESGLRDDPKIKKQLEIIIKKFLAERNKALNYEKEIQKKEVYILYDKLSKKEPKPENLTNWQSTDSYYPLFVGGQYIDIWCYKLKKLN